MIIKYDESYYDAWQEGVTRLGSIYHDIRWREIIKDTYRLKPEYYINNINGIITGGFPAFKVGKKLISLPYLPFCGTWGDFSITNGIINKTKKLIYTKNIINKPSELFENDFTTMRLNIPQTVDELWKSIGPKTRNLVRKAKKSNFKLESSTVDEFYTVYCKATNALGTPPHKKNFFILIDKMFGELVKIKVVRLNGNIVSCILEMDYNSIRYDMWAFSLKKYFHLSPNMFLYFEILKDAINSRIKIYDFGRSHFKNGTYYFKKQWGAHPVKLDYLRYTDIGVEKIIPKVSWAPKIFSKMWSKLPDSIANISGHIIRRYIV